MIHTLEIKGEIDLYIVNIVSFKLFIIVSKKSLQDNNKPGNRTGTARKTTKSKLAGCN